MTREERKKKNKRFGWILTASAHVIIILMLFAFSLPAPEPQPEPALVLDFRSSSSSQGGSSSEVTESEKIEEEETNPVDPVVAQDKKSPVKSSDKKKSEGSTKSTKPAKKANSNALFPGQGTGGGKGKTKGDGEGDIPGSGGKGNGGTGIGTFGKGTGVAPEVKNPTQDQIGNVVIEITVNRAGEIIDVKVLSNHKETTTTDPVLLNDAKKVGFKYKFKADSKRAKLSKGLKKVKYILE